MPTFFLARYLILSEQIRECRAQKPRTQTPLSSTLCTRVGFNHQSNGPSIFHWPLPWRWVKLQVEPGESCTLPGQLLPSVHSQKMATCPKQPWPQPWTQGYQEVIPNLRCVLYLHKEFVLIVNVYSGLFTRSYAIRIYFCLQVFIAHN